MNDRRVESRALIADVNKSLTRKRTLKFYENIVALEYVLR